MHAAAGAPSRVRAIASLGLLTGTEAVGSAVLWDLGQSLAGRVSRPGASRQVDAIVGLGASVAAWVVLTWLVAGCVLALLAHLWRDRAGDRRVARRCAAVSPQLAQRLVAVLLGVGIGAGTGASGAAGAAADRPVAPAALAPSIAGDVVDRPAPLTAAERGAGTAETALAGWSPDRPAPAARHDSAGVRLVAGAPRTQPDAAGEVVVRAGDTLWDIAARHLRARGHATDPAEIAAEWPRWHAANRAVIGPDPDRLLPGQRLRIPS